MKKNILSLFLVLTMCLSLSSPVFATDLQNMASNVDSQQNVWTVRADVISDILEKRQQSISPRPVSNINVDEVVNALSKVYLEIERLENSSGIQSNKSIADLKSEKSMLETILANNGQYVLSDEEVDAVICGSSLGEAGGVATPLSAGDAVICPDDTANNKWICSSVRTQSGYSYYTLRAIPRNNRSSLYETHSGDTNARTDWADFSTKLMYEKVLDGALETVNFGLLGTLLSILEECDDTTTCDLSYNVNVTSNPQFTFVYDANADEYFCTLITHSVSISQIIMANVPNMSGSNRAEIGDKLLVSPNHTSPSFLAISRFRQGMTWSQVERIGYCSIFCQKGTTKESITSFEPPYAIGISTIY